MPSAIGVGHHESGVAALLEDDDQRDDEADDERRQGQHVQAAPRREPARDDRRARGDRGLGDDVVDGDRALTGVGAPEADLGTVGVGGSAGRHAAAAVEGGVARPARRAGCGTPGCYCCAPGSSSERVGIRTGQRGSGPHRSRWVKRTLLVPSTRAPVAPARRTVPPPTSRIPRCWGLATPHERLLSRASIDESRRQGSKAAVWGKSWGRWPCRGGTC